MAGVSLLFCVLTLVLQIEGILTNEYLQPQIRTIQSKNNIPYTINENIKETASEFLKRAFGECLNGNVVICVKSRLVGLADHLYKQKTLPVSSFLTLVRTNILSEPITIDYVLNHGSKVAEVNTINDKYEYQLDKMLLDRMVRFLKCYAIQVKVPSEMTLAAISNYAWKILGDYLATRSQEKHEGKFLRYLLLIVHSIYIFISLRYSSPLFGLSLNMLFTRKDVN